MDSTPTDDQPHREAHDSAAHDPTRRDLVRGALRAAIALPAASLLLPELARASGMMASRQEQQAAAKGQASANAMKRHVVVVGAGAFGGWTALHLLRGGVRVTLLDAWGAGNSRATSGGETRVIRAIYNGRQVYIDMVARAFTLWHEHEARWKRPIYKRTGGLWMFEGDDAFARTSVVPMNRVGLQAREMPLAESRRRWPAIDFHGVRTTFFEPEAGYLYARQACELVRETFVAEGGEYRTTLVRPTKIADGVMRGVTLSDGTLLTADHIVFACGPWLGRIFPDVIGAKIRATRQPAVYFGPAGGDTRFDDATFPVWVNFGQRLIYGIPGNERRGFKISDDTIGPIIDPTSMDRTVTSDEVAHLRAFVASRFPSLAQAPVVASEVCQYEYSPDGDFIVDKHPGADNVWLLGGGSGHGFKMGPALGEHAAGVILGHRAVEPQFALKRLNGKAPHTGKRRA